MSRRWEVWVAAAVALAAACAGEDGGEATLPLGGNGVLIDDDSPEANVVVFIGNCTGTLITSQLVLTANHCITGYAGDHECRPPDQKKTVTVGLRNDGATTFETARVLPRHGVDCQDGGSSDVAILYLETPVTQATMKAVAKTSAIPAVPRIFEPTFATPGGADYGVAGFGAGVIQRRVKTFNAPDGIESHGEGDDTYWEMDIDDWETNDGDSGGPLFVVNPDGTRHLVGTLFGKYGESMVWADITGGDNEAFLRSNILEENVPAELRHSEAWLIRHGHAGTTLWGKTDYTGPCNWPLDQDCDAWYDAHDNCFGVANSEQKDTDDDGMGDVCDPCPFGDDSDPDGDGRCAVANPDAPGAYKGDNCPFIANDQANCNAEAERAENSEGRSPGTEVLGDACDPVPCPAPDVVSSRDERFTTFGHHMTGGYDAGRVVSENLSITKIAPHKRTNILGSFPAPVPAADITTAARFCQENPAWGYVCRDPANVRDTHIFDAINRDAEVLSTEQPWHRVTLDLNTDGTSWAWPYDGSTSNQRWSYLYDWNRWTASGIIPPARDEYRPLCENVAQVGPGTCLDGTLWYHAFTEIGKTVSKVSFTYVGLHRNGAGVGAENMANGYLDIAPDRAYVKRYPGDGLQLAIYLHIPFDDPAPDEDVIRHRMRPLTAEELGGQVRILEDSGAAYDATDRVSQGLQGRLADPATVWLSAAEPPGVASNLDTSIQGIALGSLGDAVLDGAYQEGAQLMLMSERGEPLDSSASMGGPAARTGWVGSFSRSLGGVLIAGGTSLDGESLHDVALWRPGIGWSEVPVGVELDRPAALVYAPADRMLWILDLARDGSTARLVRVDPFTGATESVGTWQRDDAEWDHHFLGLDREGHALLTASSLRQARTQIASLLVSGGTAYAARLDESLPYTMSEPLVDDHEIGVIDQDESGAARGVVRRAELPPSQASLDGMFR